ncbi:MAG: hypothetical protein JW945_03375 [Methanomicrobia archaeon]|nr:hypothetical protein [Methanomicrobia archaeon]
MSPAVTFWSNSYASLASTLFIIASFATIGFGVKYIDDAFDEDRFNKAVAKVFAPLLVFLWISVSLLDSISATILFAILIAVLLSGKVDNRIFKLSALTLITVVVLTQYEHFSWVPLAVLTIMGVADERGNDYVDAHETGGIREFFFAHRCGMKVSTLGLCIASFLPWLYFAAFLAFDSAYEFVKFLDYLHVSAIGYKVWRLPLAVILLGKFK